MVGRGGGSTERDELQKQAITCIRHIMLGSLEFFIVEQND